MLGHHPFRNQVPPPPPPLVLLLLLPHDYYHHLRAHHPLFVCRGGDLEPILRAWMLVSVLATLWAGLGRSLPLLGMTAVCWLQRKGGSRRVMNHWCWDNKHYYCLEHSHTGFHRTGDMSRHFRHSQFVRSKIVQYPGRVISP